LLASVCTPRLDIPRAAAAQPMSRVSASSCVVGLIGEKAGVFRSKPSEADGESRGAYFLYASTLDAGIAKGSAEMRWPSSG
jgi:hypothetical protein